MKKSRIPILLLLMLMLVIVPAQNNCVPQEQEQKPGTQVSRLMGSTTLKKVDIGKQEKQAVSLNSDETGDISQNNPDYDNPSPLTYEAKQRMASIKEITEYEVSEPIAIFNDSAFELPTYGFEGSGSYDDPYIIDGYNITDSTAHLIHIENTTMYFNITNCYLNSSNSGYHCIWMKNVTFGTIADNTICNTTQGNYGIGMDESLNNTLLNNTILGCDTGIWMDGSHNNSLLNNTVEGLWEGLYVNSSNDNVFTSNTIYNSFSAGIYLDYNNTWNTFTNNTIYDTACYGISTSGGCDNNTFAGNTIYNCGINGFEVFDSRNNTLLGNTIYGCFEGISLDSANYNTLSGNTIYDCYTGIDLSSSSNNNTLLSNTIHDIIGASTGIHLSNSHNNTLASNTIFNMKDAPGVSLTSSNNNTLSSNTIYNITGFVSGIHLWSSSNNTFDTNTIYNCEYWGFGLTSSSNNNTLLSNTLYNCSTGIHLGQSNNNTFVNNIVYDCVTGMSLDSSNNNTFTGNTFHDILGGATGISLSSSGHNTLSGNTIYNIDLGDGISMSSSSYNILTNNTIYNASQGIHTSSSHNNTFSSNTIYDCNYGIYLYDSSNNTIRYNIVYNNLNFGLYISSSVIPVAENNTVTWNNFVRNNVGGTSQAYDSESNNIIRYNYWDNHISPDSDLDGFVDDPFYIYNDTANNEDLYPRTHPYMYHKPIYIDNNDDFADLGFPGEGILGNPYVITSYYFVDSTRDLIHIENTTKYFRIINNILSCIGSGNTGILLDNVTHGTIDDNNIHNCGNGIYMTSSHNNTLTGNTIYDITNMGISLYSSSNNNTLLSNTIHDCHTGIHISSSHNNTLLSNTIHDIVGIFTGIHLSNSHNNTLITNTIFNLTDSPGFYLSSSNYNTFTGNNIYNGDYGVYLESSDHNTFVENTIYDCDYFGIYVLDGHFNNFTSNTVFDCPTYSGIDLNNAHNNTLAKNTIYNCSYGTILTQSSNNSISYNNIFNNSIYAFAISKGGSVAENNTFNWNNFMNSGQTPQAYDEGDKNNVSYNYWDDWTSPDDEEPYGIVDNPYTLAGGGGNEDLFPLTTPVVPTVIIQSPISQDYGTDTITVSLSGNAEHYWYYITGDVDNRTWIVSEDRTFTEGTYTLHAYGNDSVDNIGYASVTFIIDTTPPTVAITSPTNTTYDHTSVPLTYTVSDGAVTIYLNGMANTTAVPSESVVSDFPGAPAIPDGSYNITIVSVDQAGNIAKDTVLFTIDTTPPTTAPTTTTKETTPEASTATTTTSSEAASGSFPGIIALVLFFGTFVVFIRRRKKR